MIDKTIKIGTRGSKLALYQAEAVQNAINNNFPQVKTEIVVIHSKGDKILDIALSKIGDKGLFTQELEDALFNHKIDMAVHSLKDLPTDLPPGLEVSAVLKRGEVRDALVSTKKLSVNTLTPNLKIATSSLRRKSQLLKMNPDLNIIDIRGNVNTRLRKMEEGYCDAMIMAATGLQRLGLDKFIAQVIPADIIIPAVSQGAIAIESNIENIEIKPIIDSINDKETMRITKAERVFLNTIEGGCQVPVGCYSSINGQDIEMCGFIAGVDGKEFLSHKVMGDIEKASTWGKELALKLIDQGAKDVLDQVRNHNI
ncbi:hydroxymethylbilane synthase [Bacteroidales bacterium]|nr:hydroxymethylbilane synthase [Bacteroidales bacterium]